MKRLTGVGCDDLSKGQQERVDGPVSDLDLHPFPHQPRWDVAMAEWELLQRLGSRRALARRCRLAHLGLVELAEPVLLARLEVVLDAELLRGQVAHVVVQLLLERAVVAAAGVVEEGVHVLELKVLATRRHRVDGERRHVLVLQSLLEPRPGRLAPTAPRTLFTRAGLPFTPRFVVALLGDHSVDRRAPRLHLGQRPQALTEHVAQAVLVDDTTGDGRDGPRRLPRQRLPPLGAGGSAGRGRRKRGDRHGRQLAARARRGGHRLAAVESRPSPTLQARCSARCRGGERGRGRHGRPPRRGEPGLWQL